MAIRSRKLFPAGTGTNQTMDCSDFCYPGCPYDCYTFPEFYFSPPPPALYSAAHGPQQKHAVPTLAIIMIALFVGFFFCFSYYIVAIKCRSCCSSSRNVGAERSGSEGAEGEFVDENQVDHHIWFITTAGLQQSVINSITACKYKKGEGLIEGTECSVCLSEFQEGEMLRLLPKCSHAFHSRCVDTWLRSHTTCPLCRARILTDIATSNIVWPPSLASVNQNEANIAANEETQMENNGETNGEVMGGENQVVPGGSFENRGEVDDQREVINQVGEIIPKEGIESDESNGNVETQEHETVRTQMDSSSAGCEGRSVKAT